MRTLIVGCGYLGQRVAEVWHQAGHAVSAVTRSTERAEQFRARGWTPVVADICSPQSLQGLPNFDVVLMAVGFDRTAGYTQQQVYVDGLRAVLDAVWVRCGRFLAVSSSSVYGQHLGEWVNEDSECSPTQPGGQCCLAAESLLEQRAEQIPGEFVILRLSGIYGPGRLLSRIESLHAQQPLSGNPEAWLNLIHVDDAVRAVTAAAEKADVPRRLLISDDLPVRRGDYYRHLADVVGAPVPIFDESLTARHGSGGINKRCDNRNMKVHLVADLAYPSYRQGVSQAAN